MKSKLNFRPTAFCGAYASAGFSKINYTAPFIIRKQFPYKRLRYVYFISDTSISSLSKHFYHYIVVWKNTCIWFMAWKLIIIAHIRKYFVIQHTHTHKNEEENKKTQTLTPFGVIGWKWFQENFLHIYVGTKYIRI